MRFCVVHCNFCLFLLCLPAAIARADTLELNSHQQVSGTVTKYENYVFEVRSSDGKTATYPAASVRRIAFASPGAAKFTTRNSGVQEGAPSSFENGAFNVTTS